MLIGLWSEYFIFKIYICVTSNAQIRLPWKPLITGEDAGSGAQPKEPWTKDQAPFPTAHGSCAQ